MNQTLKKQELLFRRSIVPPVEVDERRAPLKLLFSHLDPSRNGRILSHTDDHVEIVKETPATSKQYVDFMKRHSTDSPRESYEGAAGPATKLRLEWAAAPALMVRCDWKTIAMANRVPIYVSWTDWVINGWRALDAGIVRPDLSWDPPTSAEINFFTGIACPTTSEIAACVMVQYLRDIEQSANSALRDDLLAAVDAWITPALFSFLQKQQPGRGHFIGKRQLYERAYELMAYDYSSVDLTQVETADVAGQQCEMEYYVDMDAFDRACAEGGDSNLPNSDAVAGALLSAGVEHE
jgi:hypothetical protein